MRTGSLSCTLRSREPSGFGRALYHAGGCLSAPVGLVVSVVCSCGEPGMEVLLLCFDTLGLRSSYRAESARRLRRSGRDSDALLDRRLFGEDSTALWKLPLLLGTSLDLSRSEEEPERAVLLAVTSVAAGREGFPLLGSKDASLVWSSVTEGSERCLRGFQGPRRSSLSDAVLTGGANDKCSAEAGSAFKAFSLAILASLRAWDLALISLVSLGSLNFCCMYAP